MKWVLFGLAGLATLGAIIAIIGVLLPRTHTASRTLTVSRSPAEVWAALMTAVAASDVPVDIVESDPPHRLVTRVKTTETLFGGTWTIIVTPSTSGSQKAPGTIVKIVEDGWVANPIFRFVSRFVIGHHATIDATLKAVSKALNQPAAISGE